jgi:hypothetical protein
VISSRSGRSILLHLHPFRQKESNVARTPCKKPLPRRAVLRWLAAAPAAAAVGTAALARPQDERTGFEDADAYGEASESQEVEDASSFARCVADNEGSLSRKERRALLEKMPGLEGALKELREFKVPDHVEPAINFRALGSGGRRS